jgi:hypothetical protein
MRRVCRPLDGKSMTETPALVRALVDHVTAVGRFDLGTWCNFKRQHQGRGTPGRAGAGRGDRANLAVDERTATGNGTAGGGAGEARLTGLSVHSEHLQEWSCPADLANISGR